MKLLETGIAVLVFVAGLSVAVAAQSDNVSGLGSDEGEAGTIFKAQTATTLFHAVRYRCSDPTLTSSTISVAVADCCIAGDIWRVTIYGRKGFAHTANVGLPPDVYSANATIQTAVKNIDVIATSGSTPGGLPAGWTLRISTNGGGPVCARKAVVGGTSAP